MKCKDKMYRIVTLITETCTEAKDDEENSQSNNVTNDDAKNVNLDLPSSGDDKMNVRIYMKFCFQK